MRNRSNFVRCGFAKWLCVLIKTALVQNYDSENDMHVIVKMPDMWGTSSIDNHQKYFGVLLNFSEKIHPFFIFLVFSM